MTADPRPPLLELAGVQFTWPGGVQALQDLSFRMEEGEAVALVGPNGAGKSTTLMAILGFVRPQAGELRVGGLAVEPRNFREIRRRVGAVFQDPDDQLFMPTLEEDVAFGPLNLGMAADEVEARVRAALGAVGLDGLDRRPPHQLSGGEKRKAALATVLAMEPSLLILDEPASNLDPRGRRRLIEWLQQTALARLLITHDLEMVLDLCPRVLLMDEGRIVTEGPALELLQDADLMRAHGLEVPYSLRSDHVHRRPAEADDHHREHHEKGWPHHHPWPEGDDAPGPGRDAD